MLIQALIFSKTHFTKTQAETWLVERHKKTDYMWETANNYRYHQAPPLGIGHYFTTRVCDGVQVIMQDTD